MAWTTEYTDTARTQLRKMDREAGRPMNGRVAVLMIALMVILMTACADADPEAVGTPLTPTVTRAEVVTTLEDLGLGFRELAWTKDVDWLASYSPPDADVTVDLSGFPRAIEIAEVWWKIGHAPGRTITAAIKVVMQAAMPREEDWLAGLTWVNDTVGTLVADAPKEAAIGVYRVKLKGTALQEVSVTIEMDGAWDEYGRPIK